MNPRKLDLRKFNSVTKYPSIETYHAFGDKGRLKEELKSPIPEGVTLIGTEKIDGACTRIAIFNMFHEADPGRSYIIGSREELLTARGDLVVNQTLGIAAAALPWAEKIVRHEIDESVRRDGCLPYLTVCFGEVYGGELPEAKQYTKVRASGFRLFDVMVIKPNDLMLLLNDHTIDQIAAWRDAAGGQTFLNEKALERFAAAYHLDLVPRFEVLSRPPEDVKGTYEWLKDMLPGPTRVALDGEGGRPEGLVLRTEDRKFICKIRFEEYERTLKPKLPPVSP